MKFKVIFIVAVFISVSAYTQGLQEDFPPKNWFNEDPKTDKVNGVSTDEAYEMLEGKESTTIIVAVIDSGIDIDHEDLHEVIWTNTDEIPGNGIDDDNNGYVDDIHGWNFLGGIDGLNVGPDNYEVTREYRRLKPLYEHKKPSKKEDYQYWLEIEKGYKEGLQKAVSQRDFYDSLRITIERSNKLMTAYLGVDELSLELLRGVESPDEKIMLATNLMGNILMMIGDAELDGIIGELEEAANHYDTQVQFGYNLDFDARTIVGDDPDNLEEKGYGNNDVKGMDTDNLHGTHVAGIIAAKRHNGIGIDGIADNVKIMALRAVPDGDEHDKDVANAIFYAVDNGAKIINMSFGKAYSPHKDYVDKAVKYAEAHGVLLVHAAGNSGKNIDVASNFPTKKLGKKKMAGNWLEVGASAWGEGEQLAADFSNYGKQMVDLFAPGVAIYSTIPGNEYKSEQGTSMASPVTAGVAALVLSYYPHLSATDLREILLQSTRKFDGLMVIKPGSDDEMVNFGDLSVSGGIVNAYEAVKLANSRSIKTR